MSTVHVPTEPHKDAAFTYPLWYICIFEKEHHKNGKTYFLRAPTMQLAVARAVILHPTAFERVFSDPTPCDSWADRELGYGLDN